MKHASKVGVEVPAEGFRAEKCTFLVLSRVARTPITTKICRELKEALGTTLGGPPTRFVDHLLGLVKGVVGLPEKVVGRPPIQKQGQFGTFAFVSLNILGQTLFAHNFRSEISSSSFLDHFLPQISALYAFSNALGKVVSRNLLVFFTLDRLKFDFGASFPIFAT